MRLSPHAAKRFAAFRRIRRAWWSFLALLAVFVFCLAAEWVCPCDPRAVVDSKTLEKYRTADVRRTYDIQTARFSVDDAGKIFDFEGPDAVRLLAEKGEREFPGYTVRRTARAGYTRIFIPIGAFVEYAPGKEGMVHISKLQQQRTEKVEDAVSIGDTVRVKYLGTDEKGRQNLSIKDAAPKA